MKRIGFEFGYFWCIEYINKIGHTICTYLDESEDLDEYLFELTSLGLSYQCCKVKLKYHHMAKQRGYCSRKCRRVHPYDGRFGIGVKVYIPNTDWSTGSNRYHYVKYYVYG